MINGFEEQTHELTDYERETLLPVFVRCLEKKIGPEKAITNKEMVAGMKKNGYKVTDARVRKIINHIRTSGLLPALIATSRGYYITNDPVELAKYIDSLDQRAKEIMRVKKSMVSHLSTLMKAS